MAATRRSMPWANVVVMAILFVVPLVWRHPIAGFGAVFFGWGLGLFLVARGGRELRELRRTRLAHDEPIPIASAQVGLLATVRGRICSPPTAVSPTSGEVMPLVMASCHRTSNIDSHRELVVGRALGTDLRVEDESGEARIVLGAVRLYGRIHRTISWSGWGLEAVSDDGVRAWLASTGTRLAREDRDSDPYFVYQEVVLAEDDTVTVTGEVTDVEERRVPASGYRDSAARVRVTIGGEGAVETALRGFSAEGLERLGRSARRSFGGGALLMLWGVGSLILAFAAPS